jgi:hypothetical protein
MKRLTLGFLLILFSITYSQIVGPKISYQESNYDFGTVNEGEVVEHNFEIYNTGGDVLRINHVRASCGCTAVKPEKDDLEPGEGTTIKVSFNTARRKGNQRKHVYVLSNDPLNPEVRLSFTANIIKGAGGEKTAAKPVLKFDKYQHNFGRVTEGEVAEWNVGFRNLGNKPLNIKEVKSSCGCAAAVVSSKSLKPGEEGKLNIKFDTKDRSGKVTRTVTVFSDDPEQPRQIITLYVAINKRKT